MEYDVKIGWLEKTKDNLVGSNEASFTVLDGGNIISACQTLFDSLQQDGRLNYAMSITMTITE